MSDTYPIAPHGGALVNLVASDDAAANLAAEASNLPKLVVNERELVRSGDARHRGPQPADGLPGRG